MTQIISETVTFEELEKLGSELDASPASKSTLPDKPELKLPPPVKPLLRTRGSAHVNPNQRRAEEIRDFCQQRKITDICHFTRIENLRGILTEGLIPRAELENRPPASRPIFVDDWRLDGHTNASCLSISFPQYKMFYSKRRQSGDDDLWVVITYDYSVITRLDAAFINYNAAANYNCGVDVSQRKSVDSLKELFDDFGGVKREHLLIPESYPTNPQSEVLVFDTISTNFIKEVCFYREEPAKKWIAENKEIYPLDTYWMGGPVFNGRRDYAAWRKEFY